MTADEPAHADPETQLARLRRLDAEATPGPWRWLPQQAVVEAAEELNASPGAEKIHRFAALREALAGLEEPG